MTREQLRRLKGLLQYELTGTAQGLTQSREEDSVERGTQASSTRRGTHHQT